MRPARLLLVGLLIACSSTPRAGVNPARPANSVAATDSTYGYSQGNPIKVGGVGEDPPPRRQHEYLQTLRGPNGETVRYERQGSCCQYETPKGFMGRGMLDMYEVTYDGLATPIVLYLTLYEHENPRPPRGFTFAR